MKLIMLESLASHSGTLNVGESVEVSKSFLSENDAVRLVSRGLAKPATKADADAIKAIEDRQAAEAEAAKAAAEETQQPAE